MRILALSWRYVDHPAAGGAELVTHEVLRRLALVAREVTCFTASYPGAGPRDTIDGVNVIRQGRQWTVHLHAWRWLRKRLDAYDRVIDQINTIPFFTPLYVPGDKRRYFIHQLAREYWWRETRGLFRAGAPAGYLLEPWMLRAYRTSAGLTVSESTRSDLVGLGIPGEQVTVVPQALCTAPLGALEPKRGPWKVVMAGRLTPAKFVEEGLRAFAVVKRSLPEATLAVIGGGDAGYRRRLERLVGTLGLTDVTFHGRVSEERKLELMAQSHVHLITSHREGWGLVVSESGAMGTPSVGYAVPGIRDSVHDEHLLAPAGDVAALARMVVALAGDPTLYEQVRLRAWERSRAMAPSATAAAFARALRDSAPGGRPRRSW